MTRAARRRNQTVTIQTVAERAGVSAMTVSNVLNRTGKAGQAARDAVLAAVDELGYKPNLAAQALARAGATRLGLIYSNPENAFLSAMLVGALQATGPRGIQLLIRHSERATLDALTDALKGLLESGANALLMAPPYCEILSGSPILAELGVPVGAVAPGRPIPGITTFRIDDGAAMRAVVDLLIGKGHRRIGFVSGLASHSSSAVRQRGYEASLQAHGLPLASELIAPGDFSFEAGLRAAEYLLDLDDRPTAICASNDDMAAAAISAAHRRGLDVPRDVAVTGFDDTSIATKVWPTITTIRQPIAQLAEQATLALLDTRGDVSGTDTAQDRIVDFQLIERASTDLELASLSASIINGSGIQAGELFVEGTQAGF